MHLHGSPVDHVDWAADTGGDDFDAVALEEAMIEAREDAYRVLAEIDAA